jgi:hypothetical protein
MQVLAVAEKSQSMIANRDMANTDKQQKHTRINILHRTSTLFSAGSGKGGFL